MGEIYLDSLRCLGNESNLLECTRNGDIDDTQCSHSQDAGVRCQRRGSVWRRNYLTNMASLFFDYNYLGYPATLNIESEGNSFTISWTPPSQHTSSIMAYRFTIL